MRMDPAPFYFQTIAWSVSYLLEHQNPNIVQLSIAVTRMLTSSVKLPTSTAVASGGNVHFYWTDLQTASIDFVSKILPSEIA